MSTGTAGEQQRGRDAEVPSEIPKAGWRDVLLRLKDAIREDRITLIAAGVAFYAMLALFPAMIVVVSIYGLAMDPDEIAAQVRTLAVLPGDVRSILTGQLDALARAPSGRLSLSLAFGVLVALWSASAGMKALVTGVNAAYSEAETRGFVRLRGLAFVLTLGGSLVTVLALAVIVALPVAARRLPGPAGLLVSVLRWPLLAAVLIAGLAILYRVAPSRKDARWQWLSWGSVAATGLLLVASMLCSLYASYAPAQNKTYGTFFGVIVLLFWLFLSAFAVLLGAELNAELELQTRRDTTVGPPQPPGERGAYVADNVAGSPSDPAYPPTAPGGRVPNGPYTGRGVSTESVWWFRVALACLRPRPTGPTGDQPEGGVEARRGSPRTGRHRRRPGGRRRGRAGRHPPAGAQLAPDLGHTPAAVWANGGTQRARRGRIRT